MSEKSSYVQILKSTSIMGGAAWIKILCVMLQTKSAAVFIGASGVGLLTSLTTIQGLVGTIFGLGVQSSAVREVAAAVGKSDNQAIGRAVLTLRRVSWLTGLAGLLVMSLMSPLISRLTFGTAEYTYDVAALGLVILMANLAGGQGALIQGMRRIGDLAKIQMIGAVLGTLTTIGFYSWFGIRGVVPSLVASAGIALLISWRYARRIPVPPVQLSWMQTFTEAGGMVKLGLVFMWNGLLLSAVSYITITLVAQRLGLEAVGIYSAAFALSGVFVNFVLQAMGADFYPRLTVVAGNKESANRLVGEQIEIGLLIAVPGLLATVALAPWLVRIVYTSNFLPAVDLVGWFALGCFIRVIQWPIGYMQPALGKGNIFFLTQSAFSAIHVFLIIIFVRYFGLVGVSMAFFALYLSTLFVIKRLGFYLTGFRWPKSTLLLVFLATIGFVLVFSIKLVFKDDLGVGASLFVAFAYGIYSLRTLILKVGVESGYVQGLLKVPGIKKVLHL